MKTFKVRYAFTERSLKEVVVEAESAEEAAELVESGDPVALGAITFNCLEYGNEVDTVEEIT